LVAECRGARIRELGVIIRVIVGVSWWVVVVGRGQERRRRRTGATAEEAEEGRKMRMTMMTMLWSLVAPLASGLELVEPAPRLAGRAPGCGGVPRQWGVWGGRCGLCGDEWGITGGAPHERAGAGGRRFAGGAVLAVTLEGGEGGVLEAALCPGEQTEECFTLHPLLLHSPLAGGVVEYVLPSATCSPCTLRVVHRSGEEQGYTEARACADIHVLAQEETEEEEEKTARVEEKDEQPEVQGNDFVDVSKVESVIENKEVYINDEMTKAIINIMDKLNDTEKVTISNLTGIVNITKSEETQTKVPYTQKLVELATTLKSSATTMITTASSITTTLPTTTSTNASSTITTSTTTIVSSTSTTTTTTPTTSTTTTTQTTSTTTRSTSTTTVSTTIVSTSSSPSTSTTSSSLFPLHGEEVREVIGGRLEELEELVKENRNKTVVIQVYSSERGGLQYGLYLSVPVAVVLVAAMVVAFLWRRSAAPPAALPTVSKADIKSLYCYTTDYQARGAYSPVPPPALSRYSPAPSLTLPATSLPRYLGTSPATSTTLPAPDLIPTSLPRTVPGLSAVHRQSVRQSMPDLHQRAGSLPRPGRPPLRPHSGLEAVAERASTGDLAALPSAAPRDWRWQSEDWEKDQTFMSLLATRLSTRESRPQVTEL